MNDSFARVPLARGNVVAIQNTTGSHSRPAHLTVLNTVIAIAWPSTLAGSVPVAVSGPSGAAGSLTTREHIRERPPESRRSARRRAARRRLCGRAVLDGPVPIRAPFVERAVVDAVAVDSDPLERE